MLLAAACSETSPGAPAGGDPAQPATTGAGSDTGAADAVDDPAAAGATSTVKPRGTTRRPRSAPLAQLGRPAPEGRPVFVVGDSLTVGAEPWLAGALGPWGWFPTVDARVSRPTDEGLSILERERRKGGLPDTILVALGTNDLNATDAEVDGWLRDVRETAGPRRRVVWVNLHVAEGHPARDRAEGINAALAEHAAKYDVEVADWQEWAEDREVEHRPDGIHYDERNYRMRASFYAIALGRAREPSSTSTTEVQSSSSTTSTTLLSTPEVPS